MKTLRQLHLYLGCLFAPLIIYFSISGALQVFRFNDLPEDTPPTQLQTLIHEISKPHTSSTLPGLSPKIAKSQAFNWIAVAMSLGMILTALLGIVLALRYSKSPRVVLFCIFSGIALPVLMLILH